MNAHWSYAALKYNPGTISPPRDFIIHEAMAEWLHSPKLSRLSIMNSLT